MNNGELKGYKSMRQITNSRSFDVRSVGGQHQDYTASSEDSLQADSFAEFLRLAVLGLGFVVGASAAVYLSFIGLTMLFVNLAS